MKILGILGSSRRGGNTEVLLDIALKEAEAKGIEVSKIPLGSKSIAPCNGCLKCMTTGECVIEDDMQEIYQGMLEADGILWSTPVYFWGMTGQTKTVIDRTYALSFPELKLANKVGGLIVVAASRGCMSTANLFHMYFRYNSMFFAETVSGYASQKGEIKNNDYAVLATSEMANQMIALIRANLCYPEPYSVPLYRAVKKKIDLSHNLNKA